METTISSTTPIPPPTAAPTGNSIAAGMHSGSANEDTTTIPCTVTTVILVTGSMPTRGSREAVQNTVLGPRFRSAVDSVKIEEAVSMKPVTICIPSELGRLFTVQESLGKGLPSVIQVRLMLVEPVDGMLTDTGGVSAVLLRTVANV